MKTLYISDLDGTLLHNDQTISEFTAKTVAELTEKGLLFSYATARSYATASKVTRGLDFKLPVIIFNGTFIMEPRSQRKLLSNLFTPQETRQMMKALADEDLSPIANAFLDGEEKFSYITGKETRGIQKFLNQRRGDPRERPVSDREALYEGDVFHIVCIDEKPKLLCAFERLKGNFPCVLFHDVYTDETWLEIHPKNASKANAVLSLKALLNCDKVICFGDGKNDIPMFEIADECYAVANADDGLKTLATAVIESNENDGVAKWLKRNADFS